MGVWKHGVRATLIAVATARAGPLVGTAGETVMWVDLIEGIAWLSLVCGGVASLMAVTLR
jgi:hypothetical protein